MIVNGWTLYTHPLFKEQYLNLKSQVEGLREKDPKGYFKKNATKRYNNIVADGRLRKELEVWNQNTMNDIDIIR